MRIQLNGRGPFIEVPRVTAGERELLLRLVGGVGVLEGGSMWNGRTRYLLHRLVRLGLIVVMGVNPGRYRVTRLGRAALVRRR